MKTERLPRLTKSLMRAILKRMGACHNGRRLLENCKNPGSAWRGCRNGRNLQFLIIGSGGMVPYFPRIAAAYAQSSRRHAHGGPKFDLALAVQIRKRFTFKEVEKALREYARDLGVKPVPTPKP